MNQQIFEGNWTRIKGKLKERWGALTDDDLKSVEGDVDQLIGLIQQRTGETRESVEHHLDQMCAEGHSRTEQVTESARMYAEQAAESARMYAEQAAEVLQQSSHQVAEAFHEGYQNTEKMIRQRPVESLAVVFGTGLVAGIMLSVLLVRPR